MVRTTLVVDLRGPSQASEPCAGREEATVTLTRSDIKASAEDLEQFITDLQRLSLGALWATDGMAAAPGRTNLEPKPQAVPHVWHWRELRPRALRAAELVGTQQAERRVLQLRNPGITARSATTNTLF